MRLPVLSLGFAALLSVATTPALARTTRGKAKDASPRKAPADVVEVIKVAPIRAKAGAGPERGTAALGARFAVTARRQAGGCRGDWLAIGERAWICSRFTKDSDARPSGRVLPDVPKGQLMPASTYVLAHHPHLYKELADIDAARPTRFWGKHAFELLGRIERGGTAYVQVSIGYIPAAETEVATPSDVSGVPIHDAKDLPFVFAHLHEGAPLYDETGAPTGKTMARWGRADLLGEVTLQKTPYFRIRTGGHDRLVAQTSVRKVGLAEPPKGIKPDEKWVDVDLPHQVLVAYEGTRPVMATLVSTANRSTPDGTFRIYKKRANTPLRSRPNAIGKYWMEVPWVMTIFGSIAIHPSYWHDEFGTTASHGCVNMTPADARWLWSWSDPQLPPGWASIDQSPSTLVRIRR